jgi:outer membrane protein OmpA-like peptidoglycan-associated protein
MNQRRPQNVKKPKWWVNLILILGAASLIGLLITVPMVLLKPLAGGDATIDKPAEPPSENTAPASLSNTPTADPTPDVPSSSLAPSSAVKEPIPNQSASRSDGTSSASSPDDKATSAPTKETGPTAVAMSPTASATPPTTTAPPATNRPAVASTTPAESAATKPAVVHTETTPAGAPAKPVTTDDIAASLQPSAQSEAELQQFKKDVGERIDAADKETYSDDKKDLAREMLKRVNRLVKIVTIQFGNGERSLSEKNRTELLAELLKPNVADLLTSDSKSRVFILGYADASSGDPQTNAKISRDRSENVKAEIKQEYPYVRAYHFGIGATHLLDAGSRAKNRAVEVWLAIDSK